MAMEAARALLSRLFRSTASEPKDADRNDRGTSQGANKSTVQANGNGTNKGAPDGVSASRSGSEGANIQGRSAGGESGGGVYPNPKFGKAGTNSGFMGMVGRPTSGTMVASRPEITTVQRRMLRPAARMIMRDPNAPDEPPLTRPSC